MFEMHLYCTSPAYKQKIKKKNWRVFIITLDLKREQLKIIVNGALNDNALLFSCDLSKSSQV